MGKILCPVWTWPENITSELCIPDWLHAVDQGIGADIAGQILVELAPCYEARSFREQTTLLWQDFQKLYKEYNVEYRLQTLSPNVLNKENKKKGAVATLKGPGAMIRHLIPLLQILKGKFFAHGTEHQQCAHKLAKFLTRAYKCMESNDMAEIQKHGQKVAGQYMALENESLRLDPESKAWHIMPKLHMFQRICDSAYKPKDYMAWQKCCQLFAKVAEPDPLSCLAFGLNWVASKISRSAN